jgi:8-oxo-dGTP diphosphatase
VSAESPVAVEAAGGVVLRDGPAGPEVLVVHRPSYDDWTFPKGKLNPGEPALDGALREVEEETGFTCRADAELPEVRYADNLGRSKRVRYWTMTVTGGDFRPNHEVDQIRWISLPDAATTLSYPHDRELLTSL